ncbi:adenylate/guanylate cyclase domain-containing protein [Mucilaginibacter sp. UC70_90]
MPNLQQIIELREQYAQLTQREIRARDYLIKSNLKSQAITKPFSFDQKALFEHLSLPSDKPSIIKYFENVEEEEVVLLFIDIADFSSISEGWSNIQLTNYLNRYYKIIFPIIYKYDGQIEKLMGDGIICLFGKPFIDVAWNEEFNRAELCAKEIITTLKGTNKAVKIALHDGPIKYFKTPTGYYEEYTMIGKPLTELYRLESVAIKNAINFYHNSIYDGINPNTRLKISAIDPADVKVYATPIKLKGVKYEFMKYMRF